MQLANRISHIDYAIRGPLLLRALELEKAGHEILKLHIGNTQPFGFYAPNALVNSCIEGLKSGASHGYTHSKGTENVREALVAYYQARGLHFAVEHCFFGNGVSELVRLSVDILLNEGDEVLLPSPAYPLWAAAVRLAGGVPVFYYCAEENDWEPDTQQIASLVTKKTKAIVVISPNNPTGTVYKKAALQEIYSIAVQHKLVIFSDSIYESITYGEIPYTPISALGDETLIVHFSGLSKEFFGPGFRTAWACISGITQENKNYLDAMYLLCSLRLSPVHPILYGVPAVLEQGSGIESHTQAGGRLREQRDACVAAFNSIDGLSCVRPTGALYAFPKINVDQFNITSDEQFAFDLLEETHILVVHGRGFTWHSPDHFRITFLPALADLNRGFEKLAAFLSHYRQL